MRAAEEAYEGFPETAPELMERAGRAVAEEVVRRFPGARRFSVVCGGGANGGDGRIAARILRDAGHTVVEEFDAAADVIVDALFGTGFRGSPRAEAVALIGAINGSGCPVVAVDLPSGVDASTGEVAGAAVRATVTVTFHERKVGHAVAPGRFHAGEIVVVDIGLEHRGTSVSRVTSEVLRYVPRRGPASTKYSAGSVLVVGGSPGLMGAPCLAALAAARADAGYVAVAVPASTLPAVEALLLEQVKRPLPDDVDGLLVPAAVDALGDLVGRVGALAVGPGLGRSEGTVEFVRLLLAEVALPAVVDADALWRLEPAVREAPTVLTPHAGELARLLGTTTAEVSAHRLASAEAAAARYGCVVLLKGVDTIVAAPGERTLVVDLGPPGLATAGSGDVLTGVIAAFLAKGLDGRLAAAAGAAACGVAASLAATQVGLVASDVVALLPRALG
jgi:NAD(P)H-hydrate epimerase